MPYILKIDRVQPDKVVALMKKLKVHILGELKEILVEYFVENVDLRYNVVKNYCGELHQCGVECVRRLPKNLNVKYSVTTKEKVNKIVALMKEVGIVANGDLNYILFKYCKERKFDPEQFQDELEYAVRTIEKFHLAGYEDCKIKDNGEV